MGWTSCEACLGYRRVCGLCNAPRTRSSGRCRCWRGTKRHAVPCRAHVWPVLTCDGCGKQHVPAGDDGDYGWPHDWSFVEMEYFCGTCTQRRAVAIDAALMGEDPRPAYTERLESVLCATMFALAQGWVVDPFTGEWHFVPLGTIGWTGKTLPAIGDGRVDIPF